VTYGEASFSWAAPTIWNSLPHRIKDAIPMPHFALYSRGTFSESLSTNFNMYSLFWQ
jgi:hypothetical protein